MSVSVTMPQLGESVTEGTVTRWLKKEGDTVAADEPLLEVSTDKVDTEIPAPASGVLLAIKAAEDETIQVGGELALIGDPDEAAGGGAQPAAPAQQAPAPQPAPAEAPRPAQPAPANGGGGAVAGTPVTLPALGESVTEGTVTRWLKKEGDTVAADEPLLEVSTDKVDTEIPAPASGVLLAIKVPEDETVAVGTELATIGAPGSAVQAPAPQQQAPAPQQQAPAPPTPTPAPAPPQRPPAPAPTQETPPQRQAPPPAPAPAPAPPRPAPAPQQPAQAREVPEQPAAGYVTPLVRKLANERGVNLAEVQGTGVGGRIRKQDVIDAAARSAARAAAAAPTARPPVGVPSPLRGRTEKMSRLRAVAARRMVESLQISAQLTTVVEADVTAIARLRAQAKAEFEAREGVKLSFMPFFAMATIEALKQHPKLNASMDVEQGTVTYYDAEHLGIAVDTERGLIVPVIHDAGHLNLAGLARSIADLAERTRTNHISPDELAGGTFTLTNTGSRGALFDTPIINQPQVGILGTGMVVKRPAVIADPELGEVIAVRSIVNLALTYDHRLVDGADAARFLTTIRTRLEDGNFESELGLA